MSKDRRLAPIEKVDASKHDNEADVELGQWFWVTSTNHKGETSEWLGCVMDIGSNFVELHAPAEEGYTVTDRVHFDEFFQRLRREPNADQIIADKVAHYQGRVRTLLGEVQELTRRLGVTQVERIADQNSAGNNALAVVSTQVDANAYKNALVTAKETTLPELFKGIETATKRLATWMKAPTLPIEATIGPMKSSIKVIDDRIYTISLYAGLTEQAVQCCDGAPADYHERLRVMQRRLYMDEVCLAAYQAGGIDINNIKLFDEWISQPEIRDWLLPFPRTLVAFRVRRNEKDREDGGSVWRAFVNIELAQADKKTFLYVRNGEQVWRIDADFEFDEMIFPDSNAMNATEPMMVKMGARRVDKLMPVREYEFLKAKHDEAKAKYEQWQKANPGGNSWFDNPHRDYEYDTIRPSEWDRFDPSNVYYDEVLAHIQAEVKRYNRIATIIQGLFDRSLVLHPHPPVRVWTPDGFNAAIELIRDAGTLAHGEAPDFEAYRAELNKALGKDSIITGQRDYWLRQEAEKVNNRERHGRHRVHYKRYQPYGNPGPGLVATMEAWKPRVRQAVVAWQKKRGSNGWGQDTTTRLAVPADELLNVSAYKPGDFKRFFNDHRTRETYLRWAHLMLAAEDFHAGKLKIGETPEKGHGTIWE